jgi:hypothetical protein
MSGEQVQERLIAAIETDPGEVRIVTSQIGDQYLLEFQLWKEGKHSGCVSRVFKSHQECLEFVLRELQKMAKT